MSNLLFAMDSIVVVSTQNHFERRLTEGADVGGMEDDPFECAATVVVRAAAPNPSKRSDNWSNMELLAWRISTPNLSNPVSRMLAKPSSESGVGVAVPVRDGLPLGPVLEIRPDRVTSRVTGSCELGLRREGILIDQKNVCEGMNLSVVYEGRKDRKREKQPKTSNNADCWI